MPLVRESRNAAAAGLLGCYDEVRCCTERLCHPLTSEDQGVQSMPDASPTKWHRAHTTWFFETFVLPSAIPGYEHFHPGFGCLFNSYYNSIGQRVPRHQRGLLSRPTVDEVSRYRRHVDGRMRDVLRDPMPEVESLTILGLHHEQQHQELLLTDIKHAFSCNPLRPTYRERPSPSSQATALGWLEFSGGQKWIGHDGGFSFDNEGPRHRVFVAPFRLSSRLATCGEYRDFMEDGGYRRPELWLSEGWDICRARGWQAPLYWLEQDGAWSHLTLNGVRPIVDEEPVCHISFYEADAFARWAEARLPTEFEWEIAARETPLNGSFLESDHLHPIAVPAAPGELAGMFGEVWQWTSSPYIAYPGYKPPAGALGEYNGKFMCNQWVLRGGSCLTPFSHFRRSYRNFFPADARWQFTGLRLARDA
jgi:ergothioneine biosynthesis protein EgtB